MLTCDLLLTVARQHISRLIVPVDGVGCILTASEKLQLASCSQLQIGVWTLLEQLLSNIISVWTVFIFQVFVEFIIIVAAIACSRCCGKYHI